MLSGVDAVRRTEHPSSPNKLESLEETNSQSLAPSTSVQASAITATIDDTNKTKMEDNVNIENQNSILRNERSTDDTEMNETAGASSQLRYKQSDDEDEEGVEVVLEERGSSKVVEEQSSGRLERTQYSKQHPRPTLDQNVFRQPQAVRPTPMRAPNGVYHGAPYVHGSGSWGVPGYGPPPPSHYLPPHIPHHGEYPPSHQPRPYPVPRYASSGSFDEQGSYPYQNMHYSPHVQYPHPGIRGYSEDVNVISPNHKNAIDPPASHGSSTSHSKHSPAVSSRSRHYQAPQYPPPHPPPHAAHPPPHPYYQYPPSSPVSRPNGSSSKNSPPSSSAGVPPRVRSYHQHYQLAAGSSLPSSNGASRNRSGPTNGPYFKAQRDLHSYQNAHHHHHLSEPASWNGYNMEQSPSGELVTSTPRRQHAQQPPLVTETSFDSEPHSSLRSHPNTPSVATSTLPTPPHPPSSSSAYGPGPGPGGSDPHHQVYFGGGGSWGSFDSSAPSGPPPLPPPHFDDHRYYQSGPHAPHSSSAPLSDSPYSPYMPAPYSPAAAGPGLYPSESFPPPPQYGPTGSFSYSYDDEERFLKDYHPDRDGVIGNGGDESRYHHHIHGKNHVTPPGSSNKTKGRCSKNGTPVTNNTSNNSMLLPKAAEEIDFDVTDPPAEPVTPPSDEPICESLADVNSYDVLCGRGGGTNSQVGNRRFRKLVQEFQPTYLLARRKEKPLLARTIVLIIRKRGGRFLKKDEDTGELFEVGDAKAEAKTSQALREGLEVRATKSAASSLLEKKKKKKSVSKDGESVSMGDADDDIASPHSSEKSRGSSACSSTNKDLDEEESPMKIRASSTATAATVATTPSRPKAESPPTLPRLSGEEGVVKAGVVHPHSPSTESLQFRKRRRMRSGAATTAERFFPDFCPPRADLARPTSPEEHHLNQYHHQHHYHHPQHRYPSHPQEHEHHQRSGDGGICGSVMPNGACCSPMHISTTPLRRNDTDDGIHYEDDDNVPSQGCTGIALDMVTGAASSSFCLGPVPWRR